MPVVFGDVSGSVDRCLPDMNTSDRSMGSVLFSSPPLVHALLNVVHGPFQVTRSDTPLGLKLMDIDSDDSLVIFERYHTPVKLVAASRANPPAWAIVFSRH